MNAFSRWNRAVRTSLPPLLAALLLASPLLATAADMQVPVKLQVTLYKKLFLYDPALQGAGGVRVLVVHAPGADAAATARAVASAFGGVGVKATTAETSAAAAQLATHNVLYVLDGPGLQPLLQEAARRSILCVSGHPELAERGQVAVGLARSGDGRPEIVVHLRRLRAEGHELSANLLRLTRIIP